jgi:hypothetical protein
MPASTPTALRPAGIIGGGILKPPTTGEGEKGGASTLIPSIMQSGASESSVRRAAAGPWAAAFRSLLGRTICQSRHWRRVCCCLFWLPISVEPTSGLRASTPSTGPSKSNAGPVVQDNQGFVWFGTPYALNRFDGYNFKVFTHDPGDPKSISGPDHCAIQGP